jgi:hypothetical protein
MAGTVEYPVLLPEVVVSLRDRENISSKVPENPVFPVPSSAK